MVDQICSIESTMFYPKPPYKSIKADFSPSSFHLREEFFLKTLSASANTFPVVLPRDFKSLGVIYTHYILPLIILKITIYNGI